MLPATARIFVCLERQDMRRSFDALALVASAVTLEDAQSGALFVFVGKSLSRMKILWWDKNGYCLLYKRLHRALFRLPEADQKAGAVRIDANALAELLAGEEKASRVQKNSLRVLTRAVH